MSQKFKEVVTSVLPVTLIVVLLKFTLVPIEAGMLWMFLVGAVFITFGLTLFLIGVDLGVTPLGVLLGPAMTKRNKVWIVVVAGFILGFIISFAEPGLLILANQIDAITLGGISSLQILVVVSLGIAVMMVLGFLRILFNLPLYIILNISYVLVLILSLFISPEFLAIAFDASGATTGVLAVPFILALSLGITAIKKDSKASEKDSFGMVSIASVGAIISVLLLDVLTPDQSFSGVLEKTTLESGRMMETFVGIMPGALRESGVAFLPLVVILILLRIFTRAVDRREFRRISFGFGYAYMGLFLFFIGVNGGFMQVGSMIGSHLTLYHAKSYLVGVGFVLGVATILAEPAVYVLTRQIEEVTSGYVKRRSVLVALSLGVGISVALSMLRILVPGIQLWHYLLPGYLISLILTFVVPKLFVGIAFDAGGVATGPMTATFILAFTHGAADAYATADLLIDGFGMIAMVALMPIITLQLLGLMFKVKTRKKVVLTVEEQ
jgi:hypothetical protein